MITRTFAFQTLTVLAILASVPVDAIAEELPVEPVVKAGPPLAIPMPTQFCFLSQSPASRGLISPFSRPMSVEAESSATQKRARSPGMIVAGSILAGVSAIGIGPIGIGIFAFSAPSFTEGRVLGAALMGAGVLGIAGGITLIVVGAQKVPVGSARVELSIGPTNLSVQGNF
jgi:hypothetical protein